MNADYESVPYEEIPRRVRELIAEGKLYDAMMLDFRRIVTEKLAAILQGKLSTLKEDLGMEEREEPKRHAVTHPAFRWVCTACGETNYGDGDAWIPNSIEEYESAVRAHHGLEPGEPLSNEEYSVGGDFVTLPETARCAKCQELHSLDHDSGSSGQVEIFGGPDDEED